jgi:hypothetical protein
LPPEDFQPGFRFSLLDFLVLLLAYVISGDIAAVRFWPGVAMLWVVGHFFLFCNIVRMARPSELLWAALFIALAAATLLTGVPSWPVTLAMSFAATVVLVALEARKPSYHGVFWRWLNPQLPKWWEERHRAESRSAESVLNT